MTNSGNDPYEVGYGKPPRRTQFVTGRSGNPKGRPRGRKSIRSILLDSLGAKTKLMVDGKPRTMTRLEVFIMQLDRQAMNGDLKAIRERLRLQQIFAAAREEETASAEERQRDLEAVRRKLLAKLCRTDLPPHPAAGTEEARRALITGMQGMK